MTNHEILSAIRGAPRDTTIVVEKNMELAGALHREGLPVVFVGQSQTAELASLAQTNHPQELADQWSALTGRSEQSMCLGTKPLSRLVEHMTMRARINNNTARYRSRGWTENLLANFHMLLEPSFGAYAGALDGVPAFIVGAGASLDDDLPQIKKLADRGIVIGVNGAARLAQPGIALTVEGNDVRHKLGPLGPDVVRAFGLVSDPLVMEHGEGPAMPVFNGALAAIPEWLTGYQRLACSGLGGTAAFSLAERLGCNPIVLVGHEFHIRDGGRIYPECLGIGSSRAYLEDGETERQWRFDWDEQSRAQKRQNPLNDRDIAVELKNAAGETIWGTRPFNSALTWFEQAAAKTSAQCIQASHGGAVLKGWASMPLADVVRGLPGRPYSLSPVDCGLAPGMLLAWLEKQMTETLAAVHAGEELHRRPSKEAIETFRQALSRSVLLDPWCHAAVNEVSDARREEPPNGNAYRERQAGLEHASGVGWAMATEGPKLLEALVMAATRIREAGGSELQDCRMPPGAADDLLRCSLRSMQRYDEMSRTRKAISWLRA